MATIAEIRAKYPQYEDMSDRQLADALYVKHYSDMPRAEFDKKVGLAPVKLVGSPGKMDPVQGGVSENVQPLDAKGSYDFNLKRIRDRYYPQLSDEQWQRAMDAKGFLGESMTNLKPHDAGGLLNDGLTMGLSDEARGAAGAANALFSGQDPGRAFQDYQRFEQSRRAYGAETSGPVGTVAQIGGAVLAGRPDKAAATVASKLPAWVKSATDAAKQGALFGFASTEGDLKDRAAGALTGAGFGGAAGATVPFVAGKVGDAVTKSAQKKATTAAIKGAPAADDLKAAASNLFENSRAANAGVTPQTFTQFAADLVQKAKKADIDPDLDGEAVAAYRRMVTMAQEALNTGGPVTFSRMHNLRQIAQDVSMSATKDRTRRFANQLIDELDALIGNLKPGQIAGNGGKQAASDLLEGISVWSRAKKLGVLEEAISKAGFQKSGVENGLRLQFLAILRDPAKRKLFNKAELDEIEKVAKGTVTSNILTLLGKFGFGLGNNGNNVVGGSLGLLVGGIPGAVAGAAARKGAEVMATHGAQRAAKVVATPNVPIVSPTDTKGIEAFMRSLIRGGQPLISQ